MDGMTTRRRSNVNNSPAVRKIHLGLLSAAVFFAGYLLYIAVAVRPDFLYYSLISNGGYVYPPFMTGFDFLFDVLRHPGGISWYISSLLFQSYANPWLGALTISTLAVCSFSLSRVMIRRFFGFNFDMLAYTPALVALVTINRYGDPMLLLVNYDLVLAITIVTIGAMTQRGKLYLAIFVPGFALAYFVTGGGVVLFALIVAMYVVQNRRHSVSVNITAAILLGAAVLLYIYADFRAVLQYGSLTGGYPVRRLMPPGSTFVIDGSAVVAGAFIAACALLGPLFRATRRRQGDGMMPGFFSGVSGALIVLLLAAGCVVFSHDEKRRLKMNFEYLDRAGRPEDVISLVNKLDPARLDPIILFDLNRALFRLGLLGETMFSYPQNPAALSLIQPKYKFWVPVLIRNAEFYYDLGYLNLSKASLAELFEGGRIEHPAVIELLGKNALAHDRPAIAAMWYQRLSRDLIYGKKGRNIMEYLKNGTSFSGLDTVESRRKDAIRRDTVLTVLDVKNFCVALLDENPGNRMAFDYLVGNYLLSGNLPAAAACLSRFREAGYDQLPRNWAEALVLYCGMNAMNDPALLSVIPPDVNKSFMAFMTACGSIKQRCEQMGLGKDAYVHEASTALRPDFGSTYFFYYFFQSSGGPRWYH
jgi:hypothetical protein